MFGEVSLFDKSPRVAQARAEEDSRLLSLSATNFDKITAENESLGIKLLRYFLQSASKRIRVVAENYRKMIQWNISVSGAQQLNLHHLISNELDLEVDLIGGMTLEGKLVRVETNNNDRHLYIETPDHRINVVPYHAILSIRFDRPKNPIP